jgi:sortase A
MKAIANVLAVAGLLALGYWGVEFVGLRLFQEREASHLATERQAERDAERQAADPTPRPRSSPPTQYHPSAGSAIAILTIPRLGLTAVVVEGAGEPELRLGPGHIRGTSFPGGGGNVGVAGHRDTSFRPLQLIRKDDAIKLSTRERDYQYKVISTEVVSPGDVYVLYPTNHETLTLVTCYPFSFVGSAPKRFIVRADCTECSENEP